METEELRGAIPYKDLGAAEEGTAWDGPRQVAAAEVDDLKIICAWVDPENNDTKQGYKLPHHQVDGRKAVWAGVRAAMGALLGARGGTKIPDGDRRAVYNHLSRHYAHWDKEPPDFRSGMRTQDKIERRYFEIEDLEIRLADGDGEDSDTITGYAAVFNTWSEDLGFFKERIAPGAFKRTIDNKDDVRALVNHDPNLIIGRTKNKTLKLWEDDRGLAFECKLPDTSYAKDLRESIGRKDITQNSFGFATIQDEWSDNGKKRTLREVKLFDISPVTFPAYKQTNVKMRLREIGIDYEALDMALIRMDRGIQMDSDVDLIESTVKILRQYVPEPAADPLTEIVDDPEHSTGDEDPETISTLILARITNMRLKKTLSRRSSK